MIEQVTKCPKCGSPLWNVADYAMCFSCQEKGEGKLYPRLDPAAARAAVLAKLIESIPIADVLTEVKLTSAARDSLTTTTTALYKISGKEGWWVRVARKTLNPVEVPKGHTLASDNGKVHQFMCYSTEDRHTNQEASSTEKANLDDEEGT